MPAPYVAGESTHRTMSLLRGLHARQKADEMRRDFERKNDVRFAWVVLARPDVAFADNIPVDRMCTVRTRARERGGFLASGVFFFCFFFPRGLFLFV